MGRAPRTDPDSALLPNTALPPYAGAGVETASLGDMVAMQQWSVQGLSSTRARRQAATDALRQSLGYKTVTGVSSEHGCSE